MPGAPSDVYERVVGACPVCRVQGCLTLTIIEKMEGGEIEIDCLAGCSAADVVLALAREAVERGDLELLRMVTAG
jgi:hypothetical protein